MASTIIADQIKNTQGELTIDNGYGIQPGQIIEVLAGVCDGTQQTVKSGTYSFSNVTGEQGTTDSYQTLTGSNISYVPPAGTSRVIYEFNFHESSANAGDARSIIHYRFYIGADEVIYARHTREEDQAEDHVCNFRWIIPVGGSDDNNTGRQASWTTQQNLELRMRRYNSSYDARFHVTNWFDGSGSNQFHPPSICITAIA